MSEKPSGSYTYSDAGVSISAGNRLVKAIVPAAKATSRPGAEVALGGFGGAFDLKAAGYDDPILISGTDGVGTKLKIAFANDCHDTIGIDLVAMCANDVLAQGAEPLFFLDYFATGRLHPDVAARVVNGIADGCKKAGCALIGGETAEMPGMYSHGEYDLAGFVVGAVERGEAITGADIKEGDRIIGIASSGIHSNGYSLARKLIADLNLDYKAPAPFDRNCSLADAMLRPTRIYVKSCLPLMRAGHVKGAAHITGGGLLENIPRCLPNDLKAEIDAGHWPMPPVFNWLQEAGRITPFELARTFNCGLGMALVVSPQDEGHVLQQLEKAGEAAWSIGRITQKSVDDSQCLIRGKSGTWNSRDGFEFDGPKE